MKDDTSANFASAESYMDLQVNGYAGVDFNADDLTLDQLLHAAQAMRRRGISHFLATVITDRLDRMGSRLQRLVSLRRQEALLGEMIVGLHLEGPFISPDAGFVGAHPPGAVQPAEPDKMSRLLEAGDGLVRLVTLAPEQDLGLKVTKMLADRKIVVAAGHCDPSRELLEAAIDAGLSMFTHLGNGCPLELARHDNIIQRVLSLSDRLWCSVIADGVHVPWWVLKNYLKTVGPARTIIVSDCMAACQAGVGTYRLGRAQIVVGADGVSRSADGGYLAGSTMDLADSAAHLRSVLGWGEDEIALATRINPRKALALELP